MDVLGFVALGLGFVLSLYGLSAAIAAARQRRPLLAESARTAAYSLFVIVLAANLVMLVAILRNDFSIRYVAENSSLETPLFFKVLSLWSAHAGSLLLWNLVLSGYLAALAFRFRRFQPEAMPWSLAVMYAISAFYLFLVLVPSPAFARIAPVPSDGRGPLPLLQNHWLMAVHPPFLYLGYIGFSVPFAFAIGALATGNLSDWWIRITRRWTLVAWGFLTIGLTLGALWSYAVLGWGGYWAWDPVENVALLPWLTAIAFLHTSMVQERRGMMKVLNLCLVIGTFSLTIFGTFLTRSGVVASVHAFSHTLVGPAYLAFLLLVLTVGFGLVVVRGGRLRSEGHLESALARETALIGNGWVMLALAGIVLLGTIFPVLVEVLSNRQVTVGSPYFNETAKLPFLILLVLMGIGPLLAWQRSSSERLVRRLVGPSAAAAAVVVALLLLGVRSWGAAASFGLAAYVLVANAGEIWRITVPRVRTTPRSFFAALPGAFAQSHRRAGALVVHSGVAVAAAAIAASAFASQAEVTLDKGQQTTFAGYTLRYDGLVARPEAQRMVLLAPVTVTRDGTADGVLEPALNLYPSASAPIGTPSIRYGLGFDLYASVLGFDNQGGRASFRFLINPGVSWLWIGGVLMAIGGLIAAWPRHLRAEVVGSRSELDLAGVA